ncbi:unnamed protein product [Spodoptera exigua]|nr:unnamed protein product [Spodoptera exigua]
MYLVLSLEQKEERDSFSISILLAKVQARRTTIDGCRLFKRVSSIVNRGSFPRLEHLVVRKQRSVFVANGGWAPRVLSVATSGRGRRAGRGSISLEICRPTRPPRRPFAYLDASGSCVHNPPPTTPADTPPQITAYKANFIGPESGRVLNHLARCGRGARLPSGTCWTTPRAPVTPPRPVLRVCLVETKGRQ